ncbi:hypothetical protein BGX26_003206 [Mortierella sp. AD094]|nr:hypothetical protein BGX26_003206 [Mortierella sp. AD094]
MNFFKKSDKNKTASVAATPAHTPRDSIDKSRAAVSGLTDKQLRQAQDAERLHSLIAKAISGGQTGMEMKFKKIPGLSKVESATNFDLANSDSPQLYNSNQASQSNILPLPPPLNTSYQAAQEIPTTMPFFKSSSSSKKNQTVSAATTPAQTPRNSFHETRPSQPKMTYDEALNSVLQKTMTSASCGPYIR